MKRFRTWVAVFAAVLMLCTPATAVFATENGADQSVQTDEHGGYTDVNEVVYAVAAVNIRTGPNEKIIGALHWGESVRRVAVGSNGWSKVMHENQVAYIYSSYLSTVRPAGYVSNLDDGELMRQITIANGLHQMDYTMESWQSMMTAIDDACRTLGGNDQNAVDAATQKLKDTIAALVRMDYTALEASLSAMEALGKTDDESALWLALMDAVRKGKELLTSGDQTAVDAAAAEIEGVLAQIKAMADTQPAPEVVIQEVPVEVPPADDYCNIPTHRLWQVLFFVSVTLNVTLAAVIVVYISKKKRKQRDDTPLVDYDIFDDTL